VISGFVFSDTDGVLTSAKDSRMLVAGKNDGPGTGLDVMERKRIRAAVVV
jgi:hypothetical protein